MFIQWEFLGLQIQETASQVALRELLWGGKGGARLHRSSATKGSSLNIKRLLWIKGKPTCQCRRCRRLKFYPCVGKTPEGGNDHPLQYSCLGNPMDRGTWQATLHRDAESDATEHTHTHTHTHKATKYQITQIKEFSAFLCMGKKKSRVSVGEGNGNPLQYSCLETPMDRGTWWAIVHGVTKRWTWLTN